MPIRIDRLRLLSVTPRHLTYVLTCARALLAVREDAWIQFNWSTDARGTSVSTESPLACRYCPIGAIARALEIYHDQINDLDDDPPYPIYEDAKRALFTTIVNAWPPDGPDVWLDTIHTSNESIWDSNNVRDTIVMWSDTRGRTWAEILNLFDHTIQHLEDHR